MLLDITLANFRSVKESQTVSFEAVTDKSLDGRQLIPIDENFDLLKAAAVIGPNGSGKSTVLRALEAMRSFVLFGEEEAAAEGETEALAQFAGASFAFDRQWSEQPSSITVRMVSGIDAETGLARVYAYTLEADRTKVCRERLYLEVGRSVRRMFDRVYTGSQDGGGYAFSWGKTYEGRKKKLGKQVPPDRSFLQAAALSGGESVQPIYRWFKEVLAVIPLGISSVSEQLIIDTLQRKPHLRYQVVDFLRSVDLGSIKDIRITKRGGGRLVYIHGSGENRFATYFTSESFGVRRLTMIALTYIEAVSRSRVIAADDFSLFLHPSVTRHLIRSFIKSSKESESQLLICGVDPTLLDDNLIRRDGIWFSQRSGQDGSKFYSLSDYKYRKKHVISEMYPQGAFGAIPIVSEFTFTREGGNAL